MSTREERENEACLNAFREEGASVVQLDALDQALSIGFGFGREGICAHFEHGWLTIYWSRDVEQLVVEDYRRRAGFVSCMHRSVARIVQAIIDADGHIRWTAWQVPIGDEPRKVEARGEVQFGVGDLPAYLSTWLAGGDLPDEATP